MVDVTPPVPAGRQVIQSYGNAGFRIAGKVYHGSVLVFPDRTIGWEVTSPDGLSIEAFAAILAPGSGVEVLLVGCGTRGTMLEPSVRRRLREAGIGVETMDTGAACRTFNVLLSEARAVAAALIAVD